MTTNDQFRVKRYKLTLGDLGVEPGEFLVVDGDALARAVSDAIDAGFRAGFREGQGEKDVVIDLKIRLDPHARIAADGWDAMIDWLAARGVEESKG
jgi:hypothetical protein